MDSPQLLYQLILDEAKYKPDVPAILSPGKQAISYRTLSQHLKSSTLHLTRIGIKPADRIAIVLPNSPEMATAFLAISSVCTCAPFNPAYLQDEFIFYMQDLKVKALVTSFSPDHPACKAAADLQLPIIHLEPDSDQAGIFTLAHDLPIDENIEEPILSSIDDVAMVLHTSGTTSRPKIVPLTHRNIYHSVQNIRNSYSLTPGDRCLNMMPLFHIHGLMAAVAASLISGGSVICAPGFQSTEIQKWLIELAPTWYTAVPTIHQAILDQLASTPEGSGKTGLRFIRSCSSSLSPTLAESLKSYFKVPVVEAYGMTEGTHQIASNPLPPGEVKLGSVGRATGTTHITIMDEKGNLLKTNEVGEICIRGENVITAYENNPKANAANFFDGWLRTGDQGYLDKEVYLFINGRVKELINRGGEKISPREIDEILLQHPAVRQAVAFSIPHPTLGEDVAAAVVLKPNETLSLQELRQFASGKLVDYKVPRIIVFVPEIPKGPTGKVQRVNLAEKLKHELSAAREHNLSAQTGPTTPIEASLLPLWQAIFEHEVIGIQDDFLALGGDSIMAARLLAQVEREFGVTLILRDLFAAPTVESMARLIQEMQDVKG